MKILIIGALPLLSLLAFSQNAEQPRFLAADVHMSAKTQNQFMRPPSTRGDRYAPEPTAGYSVFEALEKQLGLKLEKQKRPAQVIVIDHIEETPTPD